MIGDYDDIHTVGKFEGAYRQPGSCVSGKAKPQGEQHWPKQRFDAHHACACAASRKRETALNRRGAPLNANETLQRVRPARE
jgi:hypothetical protein